MSCNVCIGDYDDENGPSLFAQSTRKARKIHKCCECRQLIPIGQSYEYSSGLWDGTFYCFKICAPCREISKAYSCGQQRPAFKQLWESFQEVFPKFTMSGECWDALSAQGKAKLLEQWRKWKGLK